MDERQSSSSVGDVLERLISEAEAQGKREDIPSEGIAQEGDSPRSSPASGQNPLGALLANPALLSALPRLLQGISGGSAHTSGDAGKSAADASPPPAKAVIPDRHTALLCAIKPYLSTSRRDAVEHLLQLCRVWDTFQRMGVSLPALLSSSSSDTSHDRKEG